MATVHDVAAYILKKAGGMTAMKLQKLVYYSQAWSLVWDEAPLFDEPIQAWAYGPVVPALYALHRGRFNLSEWPEGDPEKLSPDQLETIDAVIEYYGAKSPQWLSDLTHMEDPWKDARAGISPGTRGSREISHSSMLAYYASIPPQG